MLLNNLTCLVPRRMDTITASDLLLAICAQLLVGELKDRLVELTGVLRERQRLLFAGHALQDDQRLRERGVRDGHTIHLVERPEGAMGGPPPPTQGEAFLVWLSLFVAHEAAFSGMVLTNLIVGGN
jgi:Ubiquitin family